MVKVETEDGYTGWGEGFSYNCRPAVKAAIEHMVAPVVVGLDSGDIAGISRDMQQKLHLFGRYGITISRCLHLILRFGTSRKARWAAAKSAVGRRCAHACQDTRAYSSTVTRTS